MPKKLPVVLLTLSLCFWFWSACSTQRKESDEAGTNRSDTANIMADSAAPGSTKVASGSGAAGGKSSALKSPARDKPVLSESPIEASRSGTALLSDSLTQEPEQFIQVPEQEKAVKLEIETPFRSVDRGSSIPVTVRLEDVNNRKVVQQPQILEVTLEVVYPSGKKIRKTVNLNPGQTTAEFSVPASESGILRVTAIQDQLLSASLSIKVRETKKKESGSLFPDRVGSASIRLVSLQPGDGQQEPYIQLEYYPARKFFADGVDGAAISAFLMGSDSASAEIEIELNHNFGELSARTLVIEKGADFSTEVVLTARSPGIAIVEASRVSPEVDIADDGKMEIRFGPQITALSVEASPPTVSLFDNAKLLVNLYNSDSILTTTDDPRPVTLLITAATGRGTFETDALDIDAGRYNAETMFLPTWWGDVAIAAVSPNMQRSAPARIRILFPTWELVISAFGGILGGLVAASPPKKPNSSAR